jgi:hypothetical protein
MASVVAMDEEDDDERDAKSMKARQKRDDLDASREARDLDRQPIVRVDRDREYVSNRKMAIYINTTIPGTWSM